MAASAETAPATSSSGLMTRSMLSELLSMMPFSPRYAGSWMRATRAMRSETVSAMRQATMLVSSLPVTATRMSAERRPAWSSTDGVLALPATAPTSMTSWARRSASSSSPTRTTSWRSSENLRATVKPRVPVPATTIFIAGRRARGLRLSRLLRDLDAALRLHHFGAFAGQERADERLLPARRQQAQQVVAGQQAPCRLGR